jgi:hypothetical protein
VWLQVVKAASLAESGDVSRAADRFFEPRPDVTAEIAQWLNSDTDSKVLVVVGSPGTGKSTLLAQTALMANAERSAERIQPALPRFDLVTTARGKTAMGLAHEIADALGLPAPPDRISLIEAISERGRPLSISIDGIDEASDPTSIAEFLLALAHMENPSVRVLASARRHIVKGAYGWLTIDLDHRRIDPAGLQAFVMGRLLVGKHGEEFAANPRRAEEATREIVEQSLGNILIASIASARWSPNPKENAPDLDRRLAISIGEVLDRNIALLAADYPLAPAVLKLLATGERPLSEQEILLAIQREHKADSEHIRDTLEVLETRSLIDHVEGPPAARYYVMHPFIREYVREHLSGV